MPKDPAQNQISSIFPKYGKTNCSLNLSKNVFAQILQRTTIFVVMKICLFQKCYISKIINKPIRILKWQCSYADLLIENAGT